MDEYIHGLSDALHPIARMFFVTFSRFEFALKRGDFLNGAIGSPAHPDWDKFAQALGENFFRRMKTAPEANIFFSARAKKLVVIAANEADFQSPPEIRNAQQLFEATRQVRNNLFHGEKAYVTQRDVDLMTAALFVLDSAFTTAMQDPRCNKMTLAFTFSAVAPS